MTERQIPIENIESEHLTGFREVGVDLHLEKYVLATGNYYFWSKGYFQDIVESRSDGFCIFPVFQLEDSNEENLVAVETAEGIFHGMGAHFVELLGSYVYRDIGRTVEELTLFVPYEGGIQYVPEEFLRQVMKTAARFSQEYFVYCSPKTHDTSLYRQAEGSEIYLIEQSLGEFDVDKIELYYNALRKHFMKDETVYTFEGYYSPSTYMGAMMRIQKGYTWQPAAGWYDTHSKRK
jgi:hypothetical protein